MKFGRLGKRERRSLSKQVELLLEECLEFRGRESIATPANDGRRKG